MADHSREVWITGVGIVSCLGEGPAAHWDGLDARRIVTDTVNFAPYLVHPLAPIDFGAQIPRKDQRQMEPWLRIGTYAAGLALDHAKLKGDVELLARTDLLVATGTGERDIAVEETILAGLPKAAHPAAFLNERLMNDLRPRLFLAQLPNLLAGYISILYGVTGSSRTFMGEETAGAEALRIAYARITNGKSDLALVGGAHNGERKDLLLIYEFGGFNWKGSHRSVWDRGLSGGFALGSIGAFLVLEAREHAEARGASPLAALVTISTGRSDRRPGAIEAALDRMWRELDHVPRIGACAILSGASGASPATMEERDFLARREDLPIRAAGSLVGHGMEPQLPMNIALAAVCLDRRRLFSADPGSHMEAPFDGDLAQAVVTGVGHWRGEAIALLEAVDPQ